MYRPDYPSIDTPPGWPAPAMAAAAETAAVHGVPAPALHDVQSEPDTRGIAIEQVGVSGLRYPLTIRDRAPEPQQTIATLALSVALPADAKGTHMSRFLEALEQHRGDISVRTVPDMLTDLRHRLGADSARIEIGFPWFLLREAPVSGESALLEYRCSLVGEAVGDTAQIIVGVDVPVSSVCPCSKAISDRGAHNQRGVLRIEVRATEPPWIETLIDVAEASGSSPVYPLLKRRDLRHVTMQAHDNPAFVEDMVRNAAVRLKAEHRIAWFRVRAENQESIHNHNAFAQLIWSRSS
jgi:GTP cyclohydrolase I